MERTYYAVLDQDLKMIAAILAQGLDDAYRKAVDAKPETVTVRHLLEGELAQFILNEPTEFNCSTDGD